MSAHLWKRIAATTASGALLMSLLNGCSQSANSNPAARQVTAGEFSAPGTPALPGERVEHISTSAVPTTALPVVDGVVVVMGAPVTPAAIEGKAPATPPGVGEVTTSGESLNKDERLLVDQLVGQINGRPVFANEFFAPMDARMRQMARELTDRKWLEQAKKEIDAALWDRLRDQLLLAEFESTLTPEQKIGLFSYIESIRADLISGSLGSEAQANQQLQQTEQTDLDTKVADLSRQSFIREQLRKSIASRVQVSYWDVRIYYDQHLDEFLPPPIAKFVVILVPSSDAEKMERVESALAAGEDFRVVAAQESSWRPDAGNSLESVIKTRDYATGRYFGPDPINAAVQQLAPGQVTPRIVVGGDAWWVMLSEISQPPGRSLYDVQSEIERRLRSERWREEEIRYFEQLFQRGSFSDVKQMSARLLQFGAERYLIQDRLANGASAAPAGAGPEQAAPAAGSR